MARASANFLNVFLGLSIFFTLGCTDANQSDGAGEVTVNERPTWLGDQHLRIYPLGDSITRGIDDIGYRDFLFQELRARQLEFHFVGSLTNGPSTLEERFHDGHSGWVIDDLTANVSAWLDEFQPQVILLMIGANDIESEVDLARLPQRMQRLLEVIAEHAPQAQVLVSEVSLIRIEKYDGLARTFNIELRHLVQNMAKEGHTFHFVPMHDVLTLADIDSVDHPVGLGNQKMAQRWADFISRVL